MGQGLHISRQGSAVWPPPSAHVVDERACVGAHPDRVGAGRPAGLFQHGSPRFGMARLCREGSTHHDIVAEGSVFRRRAQKPDVFALFDDCLVFRALSSRRPEDLSCKKAFDQRLEDGVLVEKSRPPGSCDHPADGRLARCRGTDHEQQAPCRVAGRSHDTRLARRAQLHDRKAKERGHGPRSSIGWAIQDSNL